MSTSLTHAGPAAKKPKYELWNNAEWEDFFVKKGVDPTEVQHLAEKFVEEKCSIASARRLTEDHLKNMGIRTGMRNTLLEIFENEQGTQATAATITGKISKFRVRRIRSNEADFEWDVITGNGVDQPEDSSEDSTIDDLSIDVFDRGSPSDAPKSDSAWLSFGSMTISELEPGRQYKAQCRIKDNVVAPPVYFSTKHQGPVKKFDEFKKYLFFTKIGNDGVDDESMFNCCGCFHKRYLRTFAHGTHELLRLGQFVNVWNEAGTRKFVTHVHYISPVNELGGLDYIILKVNKDEDDLVDEAPKLAVADNGTKYVLLGNSTGCVCAVAGRIMKVQNDPNKWVGTSGGECGFSGGPIFDSRTKALIGMHLGVNCQDVITSKLGKDLSGSAMIVPVIPHVARSNPSSNILLYFDDIVRILEDMPTPQPPADPQNSSQKGSD